MIAQTLQGKIGESMKAHDEVRTSTLRLLLSAFNYEQIAKQHELTEEEEMTVVRREAKKRKEAIEMYKNAGADERAAKEEAELKILQEYLPPEMSDADLAALVEDAVAEIKPAGIADMGKVIGSVKAKAPNADGGKIAQMVKTKLLR
jgi:hypothetical protein